MAPSERVFAGMGEGSPPRRPRVLLLRTPRPDDPYEAALRAAGFEGSSLPVLRFEFVGEQPLRDALAAPERFAGLIVTSPRAAQALARVGVPVSWGTRRAFAVGPRTAEALRALGLQPEGAAAGSAEALAQHIIAEAVDGCLLFLAGDRRRDALPETLAEAGVRLEERTVYRTVADVPAVADAEAALAEATAVVFFSPSGVEALVDGGADVQALAAVAIGPTTAAALRSEGVARVHTAARPDAAGVVEAVRAACGSSPPFG